MFDRYTRHNHGYSGPERIDVHEHRAPTDASVQALRELEAAALKRVIKAHVVGYNAFSVVAVEMAPDVASGTHSIHVAFTLNGREYDTAVRGLDLDRYRRSGDGEGMVELITSKLAGAITQELLARMKAR
jgi:hypothetical protein